MEPVEIDLRELTASRLQTAIRAMGAGCAYADPCIIGTLLPHGKRRFLDNPGDEDDTDIKSLVRRGYVAIPDDQLEAAIKLQNAYDTKKVAALRELAKPWIAADKGAPA